MGRMKIMITAVVMLFVVMLPFADSSAATCGETVSQNTEAALKAIAYEKDEEIVRLLAPSHYSAADKLNKRLEIANREGRNILDVTEEEAVKELNRDNVQAMSYGESFAQVQEEIGQIIQKVVDGTAGSQEKGTSYFTEKILQNKGKLLLGLAYLERLYDFNMGSRNIKDILIYEPGLYGKQVDSLDWLIKIGSAGGDTLKISNNAGTFGYQKLFSTVTTSMSLGVFLEQNRKKWIPDIPMNEWFLKESRAFIVDTPSSWDQTTTTGLYERLYEDATLKSHILPLLTVSEDSIYVIANSTTITYGIVDCYVDRGLKNTDITRYREKREQFRQQIGKIARQQKEFIDLWYRMAQPAVRGKLSSNRVVLDSLRLYADTTVSASAEWSDKFGSNASRGVREFFTPLNLYVSFFFADGMASGTGVRYYLSKALTERGLATYAHELSHLLVSSVMLNQYGLRDGMEAEVYTRGMFEPYESNDPPAFNLNLIYDRQENRERFHNASPTQFQGETDLKEYMGGILDVVYTLDYAEADAILAKTPEEKQKWFHKLEQIEDTRKRSNPGEAGTVHNVDSVRTLTLDEARELNTVDDLIRDSIIVSRYEVSGTQTTGTLASNGYYVVPLFSANYAGVQNDLGVSGDVMIRRQAFELLAEYGYYEGMVPYISNQYKEAATKEKAILSDTYVLKKIFGGKYATMADFKKAMFQKRIERVSELKPVTISWKNENIVIRDFGTLQRLMEEAVESDLENVYVTSGGFNNIRAQNTQVERLKAEIFRAYLFTTNDFSESIYGDGQEPEKPISTPTAMPTVEPSAAPTGAPTATPAVEPSVAPTGTPTATPAVAPSAAPTGAPSSAKPSTPATAAPAVSPTGGSALPSVPAVSTGTPFNTDSVLPEAGKAEFLLAQVSSARTSQILRWSSVESADGYFIYGAKSGAKYKRLRTVGKKGFQWKRTGLKKGTKYQYYVVAYKKIDGKQVLISKSLPVYSTTKGGKYGDPKRIQAKKSSVSVTQGKKVRIKGKVSGQKIEKAGKKLRYISTEPSIAKVSKKGIVTGVQCGSCYIYCVAWNGLSKKINVKVK